MQVVFLSWGVVRTLDSNFLSTFDGSTENSTESVESSSITSRDHLRDKDTEFTF